MQNPLVRNAGAMGWERQKRKKNEIAQKMAAAAQNSQRLSRYSQSGALRGQVQRGRYQSPMGAARFAAASRVGRPVFAGLHGVGVQNRFAGINAGAPIHVGPPQALPTENPGMPGPPPWAEKGNIPAPGGFHPYSPQALLDAVASWNEPQNPEAMGVAQQHVTQGPQTLAVSPQQLAGRSGLDLGTQTLIPLGGGVYIDPTSGQVFGGGGGGGLGMM